MYALIILTLPTFSNKNQLRLRLLLWRGLLRGGPRVALLDDGQVRVHLHPRRMRGRGRDHRLRGRGPVLRVLQGGGLLRRGRPGD